MQDIDYKILLKKYISFINYCSSNLANYSGTYMTQSIRESYESCSKLAFTAEEWKVLNELSNSI